MQNNNIKNLKESIANFCQIDFLIGFSFRCLPFSRHHPLCFSCKFLWNQSRILYPQLWQSLKCYFCKKILSSPKKNMAHFKKEMNIGIANTLELWNVGTLGEIGVRYLVTLMIPFSDLKSLLKRRTDFRLGHTRHLTNIETQVISKEMIYQGPLYSLYNGPWL